MCGRYVSVSSPDELASRFEVDDVRVERLEQRYNVAPTLQVPVVRGSSSGRALVTQRWGFTPFWADAPGEGPSPINARVETVAESGMFKRSFARRRCIFPADGFYEWQERDGSSTKQPWFIHDPDEQPLALAGIWSRWRPDDADDPASAVDSAAILTTAASGRMAELHHRMPVVLPARLWDAWLDVEDDDVPHLQEVIAGAGVPDLEARTITDRVNDVRHDGPALLEPGTVAADTQTSLDLDA